MIYILANIVDWMRDRINKRLRSSKFITLDKSFERWVDGELKKISIKILFFALP